jgi:hypothetical protein
MYAASGLAANTIVRSAVATAFPLFTNQMFKVSIIIHSVIGWPTNYSSGPRHSMGVYAPRVYRALTIAKPIRFLQSKPANSYLLCCWLTQV